MATPVLVAGRALAAPGRRTPPARHTQHRRIVPARPTIAGTVGPADPEPWLLVSATPARLVDMGYGAGPGVKGLLFVALLALTACTSPEGDTPTASPVPVASASPTAPPSPSTAPRPDSPGLARLDGRYAVEFVVLNTTFGGKIDVRPATLKIDAKCKQGPCDVAMEGHIEEDAFSVRLAHTGKGYAGVVKGKFASCNGTPDADTWTFRVTPNRMELIGEDWVVTKWEGRWERSSPGGPCLPGTQRALMRGKRI